MQGRWIIGVTTALWVAAVLIGFGVLVDSASVAGPRDDAARSWPPSSSLAHRGNWEILVFVHPHCACTVATLRQLERAQPLFQLGNHMRTLVSVPTGADANFSQGPVTRHAHTMHETEVIVDIDANEARTFGAQTSGHVYVYDPNGQIRFCGGITASRGHEGDSDGLTAVIDLLQGNEAQTSETEVFGCLLTEALPIDPPAVPCEECERD